MEKEIMETIECYNKFADEYSEINKSNENIRKFLELFIKEIKGKRILDVGCGPGRDSKFFSDLGFEVIGIDLCEKFLELSKKNVPKGEFYLMDMRNLKFSDNYFDGIWCCASFLHIPKKDNKKTLNEFYRVLKPNGLLYLCVKKGSGEKQEVSKQYGNMKRFFAYYSTDEIKNLLEKSGFKILKIVFNKEKETEWINVFAIKN